MIAFRSCRPLKRVRGLSWERAAFRGVALAILLVPPLLGGVSAAQESPPVSPAGTPPDGAAQEGSAGEYDPGAISHCLSDEELCELLVRQTRPGARYLSAEVGVRYRRYSSEQRAALMQRFRDMTMAMPDGAPKPFILADIVRFLPSEVALDFLLPLLLEGDSLENKTKFMDVVWKLQKPGKKFGEKFAEALFQLHLVLYHRALAGPLFDQEKMLLWNTLLFLSRCGEAGFDRLKRLPDPFFDPVLGAMIATDTPAAPHFVLQQYEQAKDDSRRLHALEALCWGPMWDYPPDMQKFIHAEITRYLAVADESTRASAVQLARSTRDEVYLPLLEKLAQNDPYCEEAPPEDDRKGQVIYPVRESSVKAIEFIRKEGDRGQFRRHMETRIQRLEKRLPSLDDAVAIQGSSLGPPLPRSQAEREKQLLALRKTLEALPSMDAALVSRRYYEERVRDFKKLLAATRARLAKTTAPATILIIEEQMVKTYENSIQSYQQRLDKLPAQPAGAEDILAESEASAPPSAGAEEASPAIAQADAGGSFLLEARELRAKVLNSASLSDEQFCELFKAWVDDADYNRKFHLLIHLKAELAARFQRYSIVERNALIQRFQEAVQSYPDSFPESGYRKGFMGAVADALPPGLVMAFLSPLLLEGDSWDDKSSFVFMVYSCQVKNPGEDVAEALFQLYWEVDQAILFRAIPDHHRILRNDIASALGRCGEAGFDRLKRLRPGDGRYTWRGWSTMIRRIARAAPDLVLSFVGLAQSDSQRSDSPQEQRLLEVQQLSALEAFCARSARGDYPADIQKFIHAEITRFLGSGDGGTRQTAVELAAMTADEAYLPRLEELAQNDPYRISAEVLTGSGLEKKVYYPVRVKALYALEHIRKRSERGMYGSFLKSQILMLEQRLRIQEGSTTFRAVNPYDDLPRSQAECEKQLLVLRKELEALPSMDGATASRRLCEEGVKSTEIRLAAARARLEKTTDPATALSEEKRIKEFEHSLQYYQKRLDKLLAQPAGK